MTIGDPMPRERQRFVRLLHCGRTQSVEDDVYAAPSCRSLDRGREAIVARDDWGVATMIARDSRLLVSAHRADHACAEIFCPLADEQSYATRRGMDQNRLAGFDLMGSVKEIFRGQAFE